MHSRSVLFFTESVQRVPESLTLPGQCNPSWTFCLLDTSKKQESQNYWWYYKASGRPSIWPSLSKNLIDGRFWEANVREGLQCPGRVKDSSSSIYLREMVWPGYYCPHYDTREPGSIFWQATSSTAPAFHHCNLWVVDKCVATSHSESIGVVIFESYH